MADKDEKFLLKPNGKPYRTAAGNPVKLDWFDNDPAFDESLYDKPDADVFAELESLGIKPPDKLLPK